MWIKVPVFFSEKIQQVGSRLLRDFYQLDQRRPPKKHPYINPARTFCNVTKLRSSSFGIGHRQQKHFDIIAAKIKVSYSYALIWHTNISTKISKYVICKHATQCIDVNVLAIDDLLQPIYWEYRFEELSYSANIVYICSRYIKCSYAWWMFRKLFKCVGNWSHHYWTSRVSALHVLFGVIRREQNMLKVTPFGDPQAPGNHRIIVLETHYASADASLGHEGIVLCIGFFNLNGEVVSVLIQIPSEMTKQKHRRTSKLVRFDKP